MQFWYFMYGDDVGKLNMYITTGTTFFSNPTYSLTGTKGQYWINQKLSFTFSNNFDFDVIILFLEKLIFKFFFKYYEKFKIVFEGVVGDGARGKLS
jgi:hypothetical protein